MDGLGALLAGLAALLTAMVGAVLALRPKREDDDDDVAAWRDRALAAERDRDDYRDRWLACIDRARRAPPPGR